MADLENLLLEAAGRTSASSRKPLTSLAQPRRRQEGSYSDDGSDSKDDNSDDESGGFASRRPSGSQVPLKKRLDPSEKEDDRDSSQGDDDDDHHHRRGGGIDDDSDSASIGSDLYKDDADREALSKMFELERERILYERASKIDDNKLKQKVRASSMTQHSEKKAPQSSSRKESPPPVPARGRLAAKTSKTAKDDALNELRAKRWMRQQDSEGQRNRLRDSTVGGLNNARYYSPPLRRKPASPKSDSSGSESRSGSDSGDGSSEGSDLGESDEENDKPTYEDIKEITVRRSKLAKWFMEPFFEELFVGCFVRVGIGMSRNRESIYRLCMVRNVDASEPDRQYKLENRTTHKYLNCVWGNESSAARWQMARVSDSPPTLKEFEEWVREVERSGARMVPRHYVLEKKDAIQKIANTYVYSAETVKQMVQEKKLASSRPLNVAAEKDRLQKEMEIAQSRNDEAEVERILARLLELEASRQAKKDAKAIRLAEMNRKNRAENFKNASELKPVNTSLKAGEAGYDPFSRRWTRSRNYYLSKPDGGDNGLVTDNGQTGTIGGLGLGNGTEAGPAGEAATVAALEAAAGAGKLVDTKAPVDQGTESNSLHYFELPISLAGLQKFGGAQGAHLGFIARKQKMEATIGFQVPENDGRWHTLTLTVSDYKRRRALL
ncbi:protein RTF1 homolog [Aristolochia californica]|uniref:protein RTF1 homolog n=1 Tax=Aristolochia californica TaxID=171875 RepID=UPI0035DA9EE0